MKKLLFLLLTIPFIFSTCYDEDLDKAEKKEEYILNPVLDGKGFVFHQEVLNDTTSITRISHYTYEFINSSYTLQTKTYDKDIYGNITNIKTSNSSGWYTYKELSERSFIRFNYFSTDPQSGNSKTYSNHYTGFINPDKTSLFVDNISYKYTASLDNENHTNHKE